MIDDDMFARYKRPSKKMKEHRRRLRAGGSPFEESRTVNISYDSGCEVCEGPWHDDERCQSISLFRIADALEAIEKRMR